MPRSDIDSLIPPSVQRGEPPAFYKLDEYAFQNLCADLLAATRKEIETCDVYGERGDHQDGIDIRAYLEDDDGNVIGQWLGQCKRYKNFTCADIIKASDEFFKHWDDRWSKDPVKIRRFILFVACDLEKRDRQDELEKQRQRFETYGIRYDWWMAKKIRRELSPYPEIVREYFIEDYWVQRICGVLPVPAQLPAMGTSTALSASAQVLMGTLDDLGISLSADVEQHLDGMRAAWREGRHSDAWAALQRYRDNQTLWRTISRAARASLLRFEAGLVLDMTENIQRAQDLAAEAKGEDPNADDARLRTALAYKEDGPEAALAVLDGRDDADSVNLRAALLLELEQVLDCRTMLDARIARGDPHPETLRLRALVYLVDGDVAQAQRTIDSALAQKPSWISMRLAGAMIWYYGALSPVAAPPRLPSWPDPIDWSFVKRDRESLGRLREAARLCKECIDMLPNSADEYKVAQMWLLACLANDPDRQAEAADHCRAMLAAEPTDSAAVIWTVARHLSVDLTRSEKDLSNLLKTRRQDAHAGHVIALAACYLTHQGARKAIKLLWDTKALFDKRGLDALWTSWYAQSAIYNGGYKRAIQTIQASPVRADLRHAETIALRAKTAATGDWGPLIHHLTMSYEDTGDVTFFFDRSVALVESGDWPEAIKTARQLVDACGTESALRLAVTATYHAKCFDICLSLLTDYSHLFGAKMPAHVRRIVVECRVALGLLTEAVAEARDLVYEQPNTDNVLTLLTVHLAKGDLASLAVDARQLVGRPDLAVAQALQIAALVSRKDRPLAQDLWKAAVTQGIPDEAVTTALTLGNQLGLEPDLASLHRRMAQFGREGRMGVHLFNLDGFVAWATEKRRQDAELGAMYTAGTMPIHVISGHLNWTLAHLYHRILAANERESDPVRQFAVFARHGGRAPVGEFPASALRGHLHLDVTSLLLADYLEILPAVEQAFAPLHLPADIPLALTTMMEHLAHAQESALRTYRWIVGLSEQDSLSEIVTGPSTRPEDAVLVAEHGASRVDLLTRARDANGYLVDLFPLQKPGSLDPSAPLPPDLSPRAMNCRMIAEALHRDGILSLADYRYAVNSLRAEEQGDPIGATPQPGVSLFMNGLAPDVLARAGLLEKACVHFRVSITRNEANRARAELEKHRLDEDDAAWIEGVLDRVRRGLEKGVYTRMPAVHLPDDDSDSSLDVRVLLNLMAFAVQPGDIIWADDRHITGYAYRDAAPIIGTNEVLKALFAKGDVRPEQYYDTLRRMRSANLRFIPVDKDEILYHLREAPLIEGRVRETPALITLRRYLAACLVQGEALQRPPLPVGSPNELGELAFLLSFDQAVADALVDVWAPDADDDMCWARAEWLLDALYLDLASIRALIWSPQGGSPDPNLVALGLTRLLSHRTPFDLHTQQGDRPSARRRYGAWLYDRVLKNRFHVDPHLVRSVTDIVKTNLIDLRDDDSLAGQPARVVAPVLYAFYDDLPRPIQDELAQDGDFMERMEFRFRPQVAIGNLAFDRDDFYRAATAAVNGHIGSARQIGSTVNVPFDKTDEPDDDMTIRLMHPETGEGMRVVNPELALLLESPDARRAALGRHILWFEGAPDGAKAVMAEILAIDDPIARVEATSPWREQSAGVYYANLPGRLSEKLNPSDLLPPSAEGLLRYLRLPSDVGVGPAFHEALDRAARSVVASDGLLAAIERFAGLPIPLPMPLVEGVATLSAPEKGVLLDRLRTPPTSPLSGMHLLRLFQQCDVETKDIVASLVGPDGRVALDAFLAVLNWVAREWAWERKGHELPHHVRLALVWTHAHRLFITFMGATTDLRAIRAWFGRPLPGASYEAFVTARPYRIDCAHPQHVDVERFLIAGLLYGLGNGPTSLIDDALTLLFGEGEEDRGSRILACPALFVDISRATNPLGSFFGETIIDHLSRWSGDDGDKIMTQASLHAAVQGALGRLAADKGDTSSWDCVRMILRDLPPYEDVADDLREVLQDTDLVSLLEHDGAAGVGAMLVAAQQIDNYNDADLRRHLREQVLRVAAWFAAHIPNAHPIGSSSRTGDDGGSAHVHIVLLLAMWVSLGAATTEERVRQFAQLLNELVDTWEAVLPIGYAIVRRLRDELPALDARHLASVLLRLRALS